MLDLNTVQKGINFFLRDARDEIAINEIFQVPFEFDVRRHALRK